MKQHQKHLATLVGAGLATTLSAGAAAAIENPFAIRDLDTSATSLVAEAAGGQMEPKSPVGKTAETMKGAAEMKCGGQMMKKAIEVPDPKAAAEAGAKKLDAAVPPAPAVPAVPAVPK